LLLALHVGEAGLLEVVGADQAFVVECFLALVVGFLIGKGALGGGEVSPLALEGADEVGAVQLGNDLSGLDLRVVVHVDLSYDTADLCADFHLSDRFNGSRGSDGGADVALLHRSELVGGTMFLVAGSQEHCSQG